MCSQSSNHQSRSLYPQNPEANVTGLVKKKGAQQRSVSNMGRAGQYIELIRFISPLSLIFGLALQFKSFYPVQTEASDAAIFNLCSNLALLCFSTTLVHLVGDSPRYLISVASPRVGRRIGKLSKAYWKRRRRYVCFVLALRRTVQDALYAEVHRRICDHACIVLI